MKEKNRYKWHSTFVFVLNPVALSPCLFPFVFFVIIIIIIIIIFIIMFFFLYDFPVDFGLVYWLNATVFVFSCCCCWLLEKNSATLFDKVNNTYIYLFIVIKWTNVERTEFKIDNSTIKSMGMAEWTILTC